MNIYIGNLPYSTTDDELAALFSEHGEVMSAKIIMDKISGRSKGFGFVEMPEDGEATTAIEALDGKEIGGRPLKVNKARPREPRPQRDRY